MRSQNRSTKKLVQASMLVAFGVAANYFRQEFLFFGLPALRISFGDPFFYLASFLFGPLYGILVGIAADVLSFMIKPSTMGFNPIFTIVSAVKYGLAGFLFWKLPRNAIGIFVGIAVTSVATSLINSYILYQASGVSYWVFALPRLGTTCLLVPIYTIITVVLQKTVLTAGLAQEK